MGYIFEWDSAKAERNVRKHGISFEEASTLFSDPMSITINDPEHDVSEERFIDIGTTARGQLVVVSYTERGHRISIISARRATTQERVQYEEE